MSGEGDQLARQLDWLTVISETARAFADTVTNYEALLRVVAERTAVATNDICMIALISDDGEWLEPVAFHDTDPEVAKVFGSVLTSRIRVGDHGSGMVAKTGVPLMIALDAQRLRAIAPPEIVPELERIGTSAVLIVPLTVRGTVIGTMTLGRYGHRPVHDDIDRRMIEDLANRSALAIDNARLYRDLEKRVTARTLELEAANHELETLSYSISHDLRAPLRAIDGFAKILVEDHGASLDDEARRVIAVICTNAERMGVLIDALLSFSRVGRTSLARESVDMTALVRSVVDEVTVRESGRTIDVAIAPLPDLPCTPLLVRQVWANLLGNAVKFTRTRERAMITVDGTRLENEIVYTVRDNGVGFDMNYATNLFGVFQRMHDSTQFEGTGVGLALVQRIILRHGGRVWAEATVDQGATFSFALPMEPKP
jgi:signal transduction histidine kinase